METKTDKKKTLKRMIKYLKPFRISIMILCIFSVFTNIGNLMGPKLAGNAIEAADAGKGLVDFDRVIFYVAMMLVVYIVSNLLSFAVNVGMMRVSKKVAEKMRNDIFNKLMKLPVGYFEKNQAGDIISRVSYDVDVISTCLGTDIVQIMTTVITCVGSLIMMCTISLPLTACMLITIPLSILYSTLISRKTRPLFSKRSASYGKMNGFAEEMFSGQKTIAAYAYEKGISGRFNKINREAADAYYNAEKWGMTMGPTVGFINNLGLALIGLVGAILYTLGSVSLGDISGFVLYSRKFSGPINEIANISNEIVSALSASDRVFRVLDEPEEVKDIYNAAVLENVQGNVEARNVFFSYLPGKTVLKHINFEGKKGKTIALVGHTGAGKSTIINLLMRFYDVDEGGIFVDGDDVRHVTRDSLRKCYSLVLQDTWLFNGTVFENIAYGKENATRQEVEAAAKAADIHDYIMTLPDGYDTVITEDGNNISKGQKQLLTIARAMLIDTNMLILDEATSNVDTNTERKVQNAMKNLMKGKTCFVIAHRLSTIQNADNIIVMDHGEIAEQGTHIQLMASKGYYYQMYASQFE